MLTTQEYFDTVARHLLTQKSKSAGARWGQCLYRTTSPDGKALACAVGCMIPEDAYHPSMDANGKGRPLSELISEFPDVVQHLEPGMVVVAGRTLNEALQRIHDQYDPKTWLAALRDLAIEYRLTFPQDLWA